MFSCCTFHLIFIVCNSYFGINNNVSLRIVFFIMANTDNNAPTVHFDNYLYTLYTQRLLDVLCVCVYAVCLGCLGRSILSTPNAYSENI